MKNIREKFPIYNKYPNLKFFDTAASSLVAVDSINAEVNYYKNNGTNVHRGVYALSNEATVLYENARLNVANFIGAESNEVIFTRGTSDSLNMIKRMLSSKLKNTDEIITTQLEHHSSILPWVELSREKSLPLKFIPLTSEGKISLDNFKKVINENTKVVVLTLMSNVLGYITPVKEIIKYARNYKDIIIIVDAAQAASHMVIDVKELDIDFMAFSGHKIYGPNGIGILFGRKNILNNLYPESFGGEMIYKIKEEQNEFKDSPYRYETGTPPIAQAIGLSAAISFVKEIGIENISKHEMILHQYTLDRLLKIKGLTIHNKNTEGPIISFNIDNIHPHDVASFLDSYEIAIRAGHHCSQYVMNYLNVDATCRISFGIYNTKEDCDELIKVIEEATNFFHSF